MNAMLITPFPPPGIRHSQLTGLHGYARSLAEGLQEQGVDVSVCAEIIPNCPSRFDDSGISVLRCWSSGWGILRNALRCLRIFRPDVIHIQHEVFAYGGALSAIPLLAALLLFKASGRGVVVTLHNGLISRRSLRSGFLERQGLPGSALLWHILLQSFFWFVNLLSQTIIVHERKFRDLLVHEYHCSNRKVVVIHHGVENPPEEIGSYEARRRLGLGDGFVILYFGYMSPYKGIEELHEALVCAKDTWTLALTGGEHPRLKGTSEYQSYLERIADLSHNLPCETRRTGFLPEEQIPLWFTAADVLVLPYTDVFSSSGPLSLAIAYQLPAIASSGFRGVVADELIFDGPPQLRAMLDKLSSDAEFLKRATLASQKLKVRRTWSQIAESTAHAYRKSARGNGAESSDKPSEQEEKGGS
jgi:glycosyltransferase involved in cell wall biosynthesis